MSVTFKTAVRENVGLLIGLIAGTGGGKTYTGMLLASGIAQGKPFAVIDTEARRALHYADQFKFDHAELEAPFTPERYLEAIVAAIDAKYPVIMIDSMSHEHEGEGGLLDMQEEEIQRITKGDDSKREACTQASWIRPKRRHKKMMQKILQSHTHIIFCMRAEEKTELKKIDGRTKMVPKSSLTGRDGWIPICEKRLPFELTVSFLFTSDKPGIPQPIKLQEQHRALFPLDKPITEESGRLVAEWAAGGIKSVGLDPASPNGDRAVEVTILDGRVVDVKEFITADQAIEIGDKLAARADLKAKIIKKYGAISKIPAEQYHTAINWINEQIGGQ